MKGRILVLLTTSVLFLLPALGTAFAGEVDWDGPSFDDVLKTAKSENKHVFIDFYATWCGPCKKLDKVTYQDAKVTDYLNSIVAVKYDAEKTGYGFRSEVAWDNYISAQPTSCQMKRPS